MTSRIYIVNISHHIISQVHDIERVCVTMERLSIKYFGNGSVRYDGEEFLERLSNIRRGEMPEEP